MGSRARIVVYAADEPAAARAAGAAFGTIERLEQAMSDYRPSSEASLLTASARLGAWMAISEDLAGALAASMDVSARTDGAFDVTLSPVVRLWREAGRTGRRPAVADLAAARAASGWTKLDLDPGNRRVRFGVPGMRLDFGGIGKGLAAQAARETLAALGHARALVDLGGDVALGDPPPGAAGWAVLIRTGLEAERTVFLANTCVATSGDLEQSSLIEGVRYAHIIDPRTGEPLTTRRAATVVHPDGAIADALASAACVLGPAAVPSLVGEFPDAEIHVVERTEE